MKNKRGQMIIGIVVTIIAVALVAMFAVQQGFIGDKGSADGGAGSCELAPTLSVSPIYDHNSTATETATLTAKFDGGDPIAFTTASTQVPKGSDVELLVALGDVISDVITINNVGCGQTPVSLRMFRTDAVSFRVFNSDGNSLTDATLATGTNQTASTTNIINTIHIDSNSDESTGDLILVIEADNTTAVDDLIITGLGGATEVSLPEFWSGVGASSIGKAWEIPAVKNGQSISGILTVVAETGGTVIINNTEFNITAYSKQWFVDVDGSFTYGIENSKGTAQFEDNWDFTWQVEDF